MQGLFDQIQDSVAAFLAHQVYLAPAILLTLEEAGLPLPVSDYVIAYMGWRVAQGRIGFLAAFGLLMIADLAGVTILFWLCSRFGPRLIARLQRWIDLDLKKMASLDKKFKTYGPLVIIFGRHVPGLRLPITIFAGLSGMSYRRFIVSTFLSICLWIPFYLEVGQRLGPKVVHLLHRDWRFVILLILPLLFTIAPFILMRRRDRPA